MEQPQAKKDESTTNGKHTEGAVDQTYQREGSSAHETRAASGNNESETASMVSENSAGAFDDLSMHPLGPQQMGYAPEHYVYPPLPNGYPAYVGPSYSGPYSAYGYPPYAFPPGSPTIPAPGVLAAPVPMPAVDLCNVFVKYLPQDVDDRQLNQLFSRFGEIQSSKVMVDHQTGNSLGYGFVRFSTPAEAQAAIAGMSGQRIANKVLLCKLSNSSPVSHEPPEASDNLYIKPLLPTTTEEQLREIFSAYGKVVACKVMIDTATGLSKQIGFVRFESVAEATAAMNAMNGTKLDPNAPPLIVKYAENEKQKAARKSRQLANKTGRDSGSGYYMQAQQVSYYSAPVAYVPADAAYANVSYIPPGSPHYSPPMAGHSPPHSPAAGMSSPMAISPSPPPRHAAYSPSPTEGPNLFVFHLPSDIDDDGLLQLFSPFGPVQSVKVITDRVTGESKGYGFVKYFSMADALQAINAMNGYKLGSKHLKVSFKTSNPGSPKSSRAHSPMPMEMHPSSPIVPMMSTPPVMVPPYMPHRSQSPSTSGGQQS